MHPYEELPMNIVGFCLAAWLIGFHLWMIIKKEIAQEFLTYFPRNYAWGSVLMTIGIIWFWLLIVPFDKYSHPLGFLGMDLGNEFNGLKRYLLIAVPIAGYLMIAKVKEFLAVRATGLLALMIAAPILYCCFQDWPTGRWLMPVFAYLLLTAGLFMVGMPYLMRDAISWLMKDDKRWYISAFAGLAYGLAVLICSIFYWGGY